MVYSTTWVAFAGLGTVSLAGMCIVLVGLRAGVGYSS